MTAFSYNPLSVSELTNSIKQLLNKGFQSILIQGEVSNCRPSAAGHVYFTLKDKHAIVSVALFRNRTLRMAFTVQDGMNVIIRGNIDVYPPRGSYQIIADTIARVGDGALLQEFERRKALMQGKGVFDIEKKHPLPRYPRRIAVITSPAGAAIQDILRVISRRRTAPQILILPTLVQGEHAAQQIASQIRRASIYNLGEVIIVARGGGALEDLMSFNDILVVQAISDSPVPVICGVGHETDVTLADLAADARAATPSTAAELVSDRAEDLLIRTRGFRREVNSSLQARLKNIRLQLNPYSTRLMSQLIQNRIYDNSRKSDETLRELLDSIRKKIATYRHRLELLERSIADSSPKAILERGYAWVSKNNKNISSGTKIAIGDNLRVNFAEDALEVKVTGKI